MEKTSKELLKEFVNSQHFTSTTDIMNSMKELFSDVLQTVMEAELEEKLGYEKSERVSNTDENGMSKNYRNGYSKKTVKTQLESLKKLKRKLTLSLSLDHSIVISDLRQSSEISARIFIGTLTFVAFFEIISAIGSALE